MNAYEATLATADLFERRPELFKFSNLFVPECGSPGCIIGYFDAFMGRPSGTLIDGESLGVSRLDFYDRMSSLEPGCFHDAALCAKGLRLYADKYLSSDAIPAGVRAIFEADVTGLAPCLTDKGKALPEVPKA